MEKLGETSIASSYRKEIQEITLEDFNVAISLFVKNFGLWKIHRSLFIHGPHRKLQ